MIARKQVLFMNDFKTLKTSILVFHEGDLKGKMLSAGDVVFFLNTTRKNTWHIVLTKFGVTEVHVPKTDASLYE